MSLHLLTARAELVAQLDAARARIVELHGELAMALCAVERAEDAERALRAQCIANAGGQDAEMHRMRKTLLDCQEMLATCREHHGTNSRPGHYPHPARRGAAFPRRQLAALAAGIGRRRLDDDPDIRRETEIKRLEDA